MNSHGENSAGVIAAVANEKCGIGLAYNAKVGGKVTSERLCYYRYSLDYFNSVTWQLAGHSLRTKCSNGLNASKDICLGLRNSKVGAQLFVADSDFLIIKFGYNARCHWLKERAL